MSIVNPSAIGGTGASSLAAALGAARKPTTADFAAAKKIDDDKDKQSLVTGVSGPAGAASAQTNFLVQAMAQADGVDDGADTNTAAKDAFLAYQKMSPAEKYQDMFLKQMGLTKEDLQNMPADERQKVLDEIQKRVKEKIEEDARKKADAGQNNGQTTGTLAASLA